MLVTVDRSKHERDLYYMLVEMYFQCHYIDDET